MTNLFGEQKTESKSMLEFSVNDFLMITEVKGDPGTWTKKQSGLGCIYKFKIDKINAKVTASIEDYDSGAWVLIIESNETLVDIPGEFFVTLAEIIQDFLQNQKPSFAHIVFFGEQNLDLSQVSLLKRKIKESKYSVKIDRVPNAFSISATKI